MTKSSLTSPKAAPAGVHHVTTAILTTRLSAYSRHKYLTTPAVVVISIGLLYPALSVLRPENWSVKHESPTIEYRTLNSLIIEWSMEIDSHGKGVIRIPI